jgi:predicted 2-oxoglutarate/Fe(II)-dependent dioxygenase YbiX
MTVELQPAPQAGLFIDSNVYPDIPRNEDLSIKMKQGQAIIFKSDDYHMAKNLGTKQRVSLIAWAGKLMR